MDRHVIFLVDVKCLHNNAIAPSRWKNYESFFFFPLLNAGCGEWWKEHRGGGDDKGAWIATIGRSRN